MGGEARRQGARRVASWRDRGFSADAFYPDLRIERGSFGRCDDDVRYVNDAPDPDFGESRNRDEINVFQGR